MASRKPRPSPGPRAPQSHLRHCPVCGADIVLAQTHDGEVALDVRAAIRTYQLVIHEGGASAILTSSYPAHRWCCIPAKKEPTHDK